MEEVDGKMEKKERKEKKRKKPTGTHRKAL